MMYSIHIKDHDIIENLVIELDATNTQILWFMSLQIIFKLKIN